MSIKIHHGANGSYKTSGAIQDDAIPAIKEGRVIVTNIRGFTLDSVHEVFPDCPESVDVINLSMESTDDLDKMRRWFQWVPRGAFIIFDETQILFPKSWRDSDLSSFNYPGGLEAAKSADRPTGWLDAWTRHRHWNWDIVLTTPNIRYIREDIRLTCEKAYLHSNLAVIGIKGRYKEAMHDAQENRPPMDGSTIVEIKKIKSDTFKLYQSTATGIAQDTRAGKSLFLSPKILGLVGLVAALGYSVFSSDPASILSGTTAAQAVGAGPSPVTSSSGVSRPPAGASAAVVPGAVGAGKGRRMADLDHPYQDFRLFVLGSIAGLFDGQKKTAVMFDVESEDGRRFQQTAEDLVQVGYKVEVLSSCLVRLVRHRWQGYVYCRGTAPAAPGAAPGAPRLPVSTSPVVASSSSGPALYGMPSPAASPAPGTAPGAAPASSAPAIASR